MKLFDVANMLIKIPKLSLVVLIGPSGSGKTTFVRRHFLPSEVLSSDACRAMVQTMKTTRTSRRMPSRSSITSPRNGSSSGKLTVIDATNVQPESRKPLVELARRSPLPARGDRLQSIRKVCHERNLARSDRNFGPHVVRHQQSQLRRSLRGLRQGGLPLRLHVRATRGSRDRNRRANPLWNDRRDDHGPFDVIGDVHGCCDELEELLARLGYQIVATRSEGHSLDRGPVYAHPAGKESRSSSATSSIAGPRILDVLRLVRNMVRHGSALCVPGNHDVKLLKKLRGRDVRIAHGLALTLAEIDALTRRHPRPLQHRAG